MRLLKESELGDLKVDRYYKFVNNNDMNFYVKIESDSPFNEHSYQATICYKLTPDGRNLVKVYEPDMSWDIKPSPTWSSGVREVYELGEEADLFRDIVMETI